MVQASDPMNEIGAGMIDEYRLNLPHLTPEEALVVLARDFSQCAHSIRGFAEILMMECHDKLTSDQMQNLRFLHRNASVLTEILGILEDYIQPLRRKLGGDLKAGE